MGIGAVFLRGIGGFMSKAITLKNYERISSSMFAGVELLVKQLHEDGSVGKWKVDKKIKQAKQLIRKSTKKIREQRIIDECIAEMRCKKSA